MDAVNRLVIRSCNTNKDHIKMKKWTNFKIEMSANQSIKQTSTAPISPGKPGSVARQPNPCSTAKSRKQLHHINGPWGVIVSMGERPNQRDVSSDIS